MYYCVFQIQRKELFTEAKKSSCLYMESETHKCYELNARNLNEK